jgi:hypothetical protein
VAGVQSYNGHLLTGKAEIRAVYFCETCLPNLQGANIDGMMIEIDEKRTKERGPIPRMQELSADEQMDLGGTDAVCSGVGRCIDGDGREDARRRLTHESYDSSGRSTAYCYGHAVRAYQFELRRWQDRQRVVR